MFLGWFTNKCEAYVDEDGYALQGEELKAAMRNPKARRCGHLVRIGANICRICGAPAPGIGWTCGNCGAKISNETRFCSVCGAPQDTEGRMQLVSDVWRPPEYIFAKRFELNGFRKLMEKGLSIQEGQAAILLDGGQAIDVLSPGHYSIDELGAFKVSDSTGKSRSIVMLRLGELEFPIRIGGLLTQEGMEAELSCSVVIQFNHEGAVPFMSNVMSNPMYVSGDVQACSLSMESIANNILIGGLEIAAKDFCNANKVDDIFLNPEKRVELYNTMSNVLSVRLEKTGFLFNRLSNVEFHGPVFEALRRKNGELEVKRREMEFQLRAQALENEQIQRASKSDMEHENYLKQLAQEMKISDALRDSELAKVNEAIAVERAKAVLELKFQQAKKELVDVAELEKLQTMHDEALKEITQNGEIQRRQREHAELLRQRIEEQKTALDYSRIESEIQKLKSDAVHYRTLQLLEEDRLSKEIERLHEKGRVDNFRDADWKTLFAVAKTPAEREQILDAIKIEQTKDLTPEQMIADGVRRGKANATEAFVAITRERDRHSQEELDRLQQVTDKYMQAFERIAVKSMEASAAAAKGNTTTTQFIK